MAWTPKTPGEPPEGRRTILAWVGLIIVILAVGGVVSFGLYAQHQMVRAALERS